MNNRLTTSERPAPQDVQAVEWLSQLLLKGLELKASDIHLEPFDNLLRVRFRRDGVLYEMPSPPAALREQIISRIKVQSRLDIAEKRLPQDGRMQLPLERRLVDMRVSSLPTLHGEKIVLRILDLQTHQLGFEALGLGEVEREHLLQAIAKPNGMVLITGPTGSGKTVTLYTCLNHLNTTGVNIATVEDPSEIVLPGANQVNVNERIGLTFDTALRALLRQDPDILMVGEIRDLATADMAVRREAQPQAREAMAIAAWVTEHGAHAGYSDYFTALAMTYNTPLTVRTIEACRAPSAHVLCRGVINTRDAWYAPDRRRRSFIILNAGTANGRSLAAAMPKAHLPRPIARAQFDDIGVLIYRGDITIR